MFHKTLRTGVTRLGRSGLAVALWLIPVPVAAHHSSAMFDQGRDLRLDGVVTKIEWANPHVYVHVQVERG
jgi:hypothetical protein